MASLIHALDNHTPIQMGEKGHTEYGWSNSLNEQIIQLSFQLTRQKSVQSIHSLSIKFENILTQIKLLDKPVCVNYMSILFRLIGQTRDIIDGKGEYTLSYMLLQCWHKHFPELGEFLFDCFVSGEEHPYGSWKDVKNIIQYILTDGKHVIKKGKKDKNKPYAFSEENSLVVFAAKRMNEQLRKDVESDTPSLAAKWVPRETTQHSQLFTYLATEYFKEYLSTAKSPESKKSAVLKAKTNYRKLITSLNKKIDTVQIKQCANHWSAIDPTHQTSITMHKQKKAFLNLDKKGLPRFNTEDRIECAKTFTDFASKAAKGEVQIKGKRVGLNDFTKDALLLGNGNTSEINILNAQWVSNSSQTKALGKMIAMVDVSGSMDGDPLHAAIALGCRIAEKSVLGKRALTFSSTPHWIRLDDCDTFTSMVQRMQHAHWGMNTDFEAAMDLILDVIVASALPAEEVSDMILTILSDMQIDAAGSTSATMMQRIEEKYAKAGIQVCGKPYKPPHILFWNLRSTNGFPTLSSQPNASMMSGFSPALLNLFCDEGISALQDCTPWSMFMKSINLPRYAILDAKVRNVMEL